MVSQGRTVLEYEVDFRPLLRRGLLVVIGFTLFAVLGMLVLDFPPLMVPMFGLLTVVATMGTAVVWQVSVARQHVQEFFRAAAVEWCEECAQGRAAEGGPPDVRQGEAGAG